MSAIVTKHSPRLKANPANLNHVKRLRKVNEFLFCISSHNKYMYLVCIHRSEENFIDFFLGGGRGWVSEGLREESAKNEV